MAAVEDGCLRIQKTESFLTLAGALAEHRLLRFGKATIRDLYTDYYRPRMTETMVLSPWQAAMNISSFGLRRSPFMLSIR